jgi:hypothetical protein
MEAFKPCCNKDPLVEPKILWLSANLGKETSFQKQQIGEMHHNTQPCDLRIEQPNKVFLIGASGKQSPLPTPSNPFQVHQRGSFYELDTNLSFARPKSGVLNGVSYIFWCCYYPALLPSHFGIRLIRRVTLQAIVRDEDPEWFHQPCLTARFNFCGQKRVQVTEKKTVNPNPSK